MSASHMLLMFLQPSHFPSVFHHFPWPFWAISVQRVFHKRLPLTKEQNKRTSGQQTAKNKAYLCESACVSAYCVVKTPVSGQELGPIHAPPSLWGVG